MTDRIFIAKGLRFYFATRGILGKSKWIHAVDDVSFDIKRGETFGLLGESGCGKSTLGRVLVGLYSPRAGRVIFEGTSLSEVGKRDIKKIRRKIGMVFQDPFSSLNPRMTIVDIVTEPIAVHGLIQGRNRVKVATELMEKVGLKPEHLYRYPHEFSGGQRQRIAIARALASEPDFILLDEPTSALDVSVQAQVLNLFRQLQRDFGLTYMLISHDLSVINHLSDRVAVMYLGRIVETGNIGDVFNSPQHPYTQALMSAVPIPDPDRKRERILLKGDVPSLANPPPGCRFHTRCPYAMSICKENEPDFVDMGNGHLAACFLLHQGSRSNQSQLVENKVVASPLGFDPSPQR